MSIEKWSRLSKETVFRCPYYVLSHDRYRLPNGEVTSYHYVDIPGSTMVVPETEDGRLLLVRQYRYLMGRESLEFPAGGMPLGSEPQQNARKELLEETGFRAERWRSLGKFAPYNGVSNEFCHVFHATDLVAHRPDPDHTEEIELVWMHPGQVRAEIRDGRFWDGMSIAAFRFFELMVEDGRIAP